MDPIAANGDQDAPARIAPDRQQQPGADAFIRARPGLPADIAGGCFLDRLYEPAEVAEWLALAGIRAQARGDGGHGHGRCRIG